MKIAWPWMLFLLVPLIATALRRPARRDTQALPFSSLTPFLTCPPTWRQRLSQWMGVLRLGILALFVIALSRPEMKQITPMPPREGIAMELVVDLSSSMDTPMPYDGQSLSRIAIVRQVLGDFLKGSGEFKGRPNDLIGLITFARFADTICPFTLDHDTLAYFVQNLKAQSAPNEDGTAIGDALCLADARLKTAEEHLQKTLPGLANNYEIKSKVILLLTDGKNNCGRHLPLEAAALARQWGIRIHIIAIDPDVNFHFVHSPSGMVQVPDDPDPEELVMQRIAEESGGIYRTVNDGDALRNICHEIDGMEKSRIQTGAFTSYQPVTGPVIAAALLLLILQAILETTWLRKTP